jgi:hypothetical protein
MAQVDAWVSVVGSAVTGATALVSAALAQRATQTRDHNTRLRERRSEVYVEAVRWLQPLLDALPTDDDASVPLTANFSVPTKLRAELAVYASQEVRHCMQSIVGDGRPRFWVEGAIDTIRDELQGSNPLTDEREPTRRELFTWWLHSLSPSGIRFRLSSRRAYRKWVKNHGQRQFESSTDPDESDHLVEDNKWD